MPSTPPLPESELPQLALVRQLADEAERQLGRGDDFGHGLAVSLAQDAVELLIRIVVRSRHAQVGERATLEKMIEAIDKLAATDEEKVPHRARVEDLNKARVAFKHSGLVPSASDARRLIRFGVEFLEVAVPRLCGIELRQISLSYTIADAALRDVIVKAEQALAEERFMDAITDAAEAVARVEFRLERLLPSSPRLRLDDERSTSQVNGLAKYVGGVRLVALAGLVGFDLQRLLRFRKFAPSIFLGLDGSRQQVVDTLLRARTADEADFAVRFAIEFALAVQRRVG